MIYKLKKRSSIHIIECRDVAVLRDGRIEVRLASPEEEHETADSHIGSDCGKLIFLSDEIEMFKIFE